MQVLYIFGILIVYRGSIDEDLASNFVKRATTGTGRVTTESLSSRPVTNRYNVHYVY